MPSIPNLPKGSRQQLQNIWIYKVFLFSFCNYFVAVLKDHINKRHPLWPNPWLQPFQVHCNPAFLQVWDWSQTCTTPRHKTPIQLQTIPEWNLRLKTFKQGDLLGKGNSLQQRELNGQHEVLSNPNLKFYSLNFFYSSLKQGFILNDIPGNSYTRGKKCPLLAAKSIMLLGTIFSKN